VPPDALFMASSTRGCELGAKVVSIRAGNRVTGLSLPQVERRKCCAVSPRCGRMAAACHAIAAATGQDDVAHAAEAANPLESQAVSGASEWVP
jgi:hypothetical protein